MELIKITDKQVFARAIKILNAGGIIICPTDTVYGFLADTTNKKAVEKIFKIKKRPRSKPLPVFVKDFKMAQNLVKINASQIKILKKHWPGKYTFVLKSKQKIGTIALRIPKHKFLLALLKKINRPLAQTSVNISGQPPLIKISEIIKKFGTSEVPMLIIDAGNLPKRNPSKIIDLTVQRLTRLR